MAREMKDSGVAWIGEIPADWSIVKIKAGVHKVGSGKTPSGGATSYADEGVLFLRSQNVYDTGLELSNPTYITPEVDEEMKGTRVFPNDVLLNITGGSIGRCCIFPESLETANVNQHVSIIRVDERVFLPEFMHYYWISPLGSMAINLYQTGGNREGMSAEAIKNTPIILMPLEEQKHICKVLDFKCAKIDAVLDKTRSSIEEYKKLKQAIITQAVTKGIRGDRPMKKSGIEWIGSCPANWTIIRIKWLLEEGKDRSTEGTEEPLSMSQKYGILPTKEMDIVPNMASSFVGAKLVHKGDLVFNKLKAHLGVFAVSDYDGLVSPDYAVYRTTSLANAKYLEYLFKTPQYISEFKKKSTGIAAGLTRLYTEGLYSIFCALPPIEEQQEIVSYLQGETVAMDALIQKKEQFLAELETYKKSLIYEYVTGKKGG